MNGKFLFGFVLASIAASLFVVGQKNELQARIEQQNLHLLEMEIKITQLEVLMITGKKQQPRCVGVDLKNDLLWKIVDEEATQSIIFVPYGYKCN